VTTDDPRAALHAELLRRIAAGDKLAFRELYTGTAPQLFAVVLRILRRRDLAEEAMHDTWIRIWTKAGTYRPERGDALGWMISIARYRALDLQRSARAARLVDDGDERIAALATGEPGPAAAAELATDSRALRACLERLSPEQQRSVGLAFLDGYTHEQIAAATGSPLGTVKSWVRRGLQALRHCLDGTVPA
jgi:RNA polymerase sigma-70 factor (ECF subfamily)